MRRSLRIRSRSSCSAENTNYNCLAEIRSSASSQSSNTAKGGQPLSSVGCSSQKATPFLRQHQGRQAYQAAITQRVRSYQLAAQRNTQTLLCRLHHHAHVVEDRHGIHAAGMSGLRKPAFPAIIITQQGLMRQRSRVAAHEAFGHGRIAHHDQRRVRQADALEAAPRTFSLAEPRRENHRA